MVVLRPSLLITNAKPRHCFRGQTIESQDAALMLIAI